jgi:heat shock protein HtpX
MRRPESSGGRNLRLATQHTSTGKDNETTSMTTRLRTWILISGLTALFVSLGAFVGGTGGLVVFLAIAVVFNFAMFWFSDRLALKMSRARPFEPGEMPEVVHDVAELAGTAGIPQPRLYVIPSQQPNAFATGRSPKTSAVAVTEGLVTLLPREQVRGVLAHELAHVKNRDVLVTTVAAMIGAAISAVANFLQFSWLFGGEDEESPLGVVGTIAAILIAPIAAMLLQLAVSRQREFLADATAADLLGEGRPLADALGSLERGVEAIPMAVNPATASLYIASPLAARGMSSLFSTHPPIPVRIAKLRERDAKRGIHY